AVWLDPNKTSPFDFYQYWRNIGDADVDKCIKMLTFIPIEEIKEIEKWDSSRINEKKELLAFELTAMVHGEEEAKKAQDGARALFAGGGDMSNVPAVALKEEDFRDGVVDIMQLLVSTGLCASRSEARRAVEQGGVTVNGEKVDDIKAAYDKSAFTEEFLLKKGKKSFCKVTC
ncbi:MAG: tyrosine--tRNA ligase, partial [Lachnospiraceae bacterium]|nr:tyrosine--tRNA ligase [Lachnospiraceae bacterium]